VWWNEAIADLGFQKKENKDSTVGAAFSRDLAISTIYRLLDLGCKMRFQCSPLPLRFRRDFRFAPTRFRFSVSFS
jgi:hypothetical protein